MLIDRNIANYIVFAEDSILNALKKISDNKSRIIFSVTETGVLEGVLTDGDFRRWLVKQNTIDLNQPVSRLTNKNFKAAPIDLELSKLQDYFSDQITFIPLLDAEGHLIAIAHPEPTTIEISQLTTAQLESLIGDSLRGSVQVKQTILDTMLSSIAAVAERIIASLRRGNKILLIGNGGSAADAQHIAAEFVGRFEKERRSWPAIALTTDTSILTALVNDYGVETMFARQIEGVGEAGDLVLAISTSGNSRNVLEAVKAARVKGLTIIGLTGQSGGKLADLCDLAITVPSSRTARIQEAHITICHALCEVVEAALHRE